MAQAITKSTAKAKGTQKTGSTSAVNKESLASKTKSKGKDMSEASILEFSTDVASAEAPAPLPIGEYTAEIRGAERKTSAKGNAYGSVTFYIPSEQYPIDFTEGDPDGIVLPFNRVAVEDTPAARYRLRKFCEAIGAKASNKINMNDWIGNTATVVVEHETFEGETRAVIKKVIAS